MPISLAEPSLNLQSVLVDMAYDAIVHHVGKHATREHAKLALDIWKANEALTGGMRDKVLARFWPTTATGDIVGYLPVTPS